MLRNARRNATGSRVGFVGNLKIIVPGPTGEEVIDGSRFYDPKYWDPPAVPGMARLDLDAASRRQRLDWRIAECDIAEAASAHAQSEARSV